MLYALLGRAIRKPGLLASTERHKIQGSQVRPCKALQSGRPNLDSSSWGLAGAVPPGRAMGARQLSKQSTAPILKRIA